MFETLFRFKNIVLRRSEKSELSSIKRLSKTLHEAIYGSWCDLWTADPICGLHIEIVRLRYSFYGPNNDP